MKRQGVGVRSNPGGERATTQSATSISFTPISVIIPTLNEAATIEAIVCLARSLPRVGEVIVADGGSRDRTVDVARLCGAQIIMSEPGRGAQLRAGAAVARGDVLWFLHADTLPSAGADAEMLGVLADSSIVGGNCRIRFDGTRRAARFLTWLYPQLRRLNLRYGDSGIFARADAYRTSGGFNSFPLFEDLDFLRRLRRHGQLVTLDAIVTTSSRRFEHNSFALTFARWSLLQVLYWCGVSPHRLSRGYKHVRASEGGSSFSGVSKH